MGSLKDVLRHTPDWRQHTHEGAHKVLSGIERCHTSALGYHTYQCDNSSCNKVHLQYHSCRNRHCPHCGYGKVQVWMEDRLRELLPTRYFHVVFTLPYELHSLVWGHRKALFKLLFDSAAHCLLTLSKDPKYLGAVPAITAVLHTWGQQLQFHPHVHCIVSGGGADANNQWHELKKGFGDFLFPYNVMMPLYRGYFLHHLNQMVKAGTVRVPENTNWPKLRDRLHKTKWTVFAKSPVQSPDKVVEYLARYTQKIAISNHRIMQVDERGVVFTWKDYRQGGKRKTVRLSREEFLRRFSAHILPPRFVRIRHYGLLTNRNRKTRLAAIMKNMGVQPCPEVLEVSPEVKRLLTFGRSAIKCTACNKGTLVLAGVVYPSARGDPTKAIEHIVQKRQAV